MEIFHKEIKAWITSAVTEERLFFPWHISYVTITVTTTYAITVSTWQVHLITSTKYFLFVKLFKMVDNKPQLQIKLGVLWHQHWAQWLASYIKKKHVTMKRKAKGWTWRWECLALDGRLFFVFVLQDTEWNHTQLRNCSLCKAVVKWPHNLPDMQNEVML